MCRIVPLAVEASADGFKGFRVDSVVLLDDHDSILFDAGFPGMADDFEKALEKAGIGIENLTGIFISHQDHDHIGSLAEIKRRAPKAKAFATAVTAGAASGRDKPVRLALEEEEHLRLPLDKRLKRPAPSTLWPKIEFTEIECIVEGGDVLPWCGGTEVILTPGHMPGHASLYVRKKKAFIAGDAAEIAGGELQIPKVYSLDLKMAARCLREAGEKFDVREVYCYHGGIWRGDASKELRRLGK
ncbi:MAG: MBL fold metallo-hydrolase [Clostridiales bacterium]|nr:MBL fold metallo-hydrolase [Clostridiales bacterium]